MTTTHQAGPAHIRGGHGVSDVFTPKYRVTAACVLVKSAGGIITHAYQGCLLEWLSPEQEKLFFELDYIELVDAEPVAAGKK